MRIKLLLLFLFLHHCSSNLWGQANVYHPFPEDTASWVVHTYSNPCQGYCNSNYYEMRGDTILNSVSYNKIYHRDAHFYYITPPTVVGATYGSLKYIGAVRQDSINKKVYYIDSTMTKDTLLYDFSLNLGDTIRPLYKANMALKITKIDSILINNNYHKIFYFFNITSVEWSLIEGVGWGGDFFGILYYAGGSYNLTCFSGNLVGGSGGFGGNECTYTLGPTVGIHKPEATSIYFRAYPDPSNGIFTIKNENGRINLISIYNTIGEIIFQSTILNPQSTIDLSSQPNGIYFLQLKTEAGIVNKKIIIQH